MSDSPPEKSDSAVEEDDGGELWFDDDVDNSELAEKERIRGLSPVPTEHGRKVAFNALPVEASKGAGGYKNYWTDPDPPKEAEAYIQEGPQRDPPEPENSWRVVEYYCGSCHRRCLVDHAERAAKMRECRDCARVPAIDDEIRDHRVTSLLWAHLAAEESTARSGEATSVLPALSAPKRGSEEPAGSDPSRVDPEAGPHEAGGRRTRTWVGAVGSPAEAVSTPEETQQRLSDYAVPDGGERE